MVSDVLAREQRVVDVPDIAQAPAPFAEVAGRLDLRFETRPASGQTTLRVLDQRPPLRVVRAFACDDGGALVHLHNVSGGVLGGDQLELNVEVAADARAQITTTGATRLYRCRYGSPAAVQQSVIEVGPGGLLEYVPDPLLPFAGSRYRQHTRVELAAGAGLFWWEMLAPGREGRGERFGYDELELSFALRAEGRPIAYERARLEPHERALDSLARFGPYTHFASFYICRVGQPRAQWLALETRLAALAQELTTSGKVLWGASMLPAHGLSVRGLSRSGRAISLGLPIFWDVAKRELYGLPAAPPRKVQ